MAAGGHGLPARPADLVPDACRQRFGGQHQRVQREHRPAQAGEGHAVALGGPDDHLGRDRPAGGVDPAGPDAGRLGGLVDRRPQPLDHLGQPAGQPGRVHGGAVGGEGGVEQPGHPDPPLGLGPPEQPQVVGAHAPPAGVPDPGLQAGQLHRGGDHLERARLHVVAVDALPPGHPADLVDGVEHLPLEGDRGPPPDPAGHPLPVHGHERRAPAAVAARGPEPGDLPLQHRHPQPRVGAPQVVGGPEPGVAGPDDRHVDVDRGPAGAAAGPAGRRASWSSHSERLR